MIDRLQNKHSTNKKYVWKYFLVYTACSFYLQQEVLLCLEN